MATGKFADQLNTLGVASIVGANDLFTVYDDSATEHKAVAADDVLKRWLSTADVSWLSTLAMSSTDPAADKFLVWDASATAFKVITGSDFLNKTFQGASQLTLALTSSTWDTSADSFAVFDSSAQLWKRLNFNFITDKLRPFVTTDVVATPTPIAADKSGQRFTNRGAPAMVEFDLPAATAGFRLSFNRITNFAVRLDPNGTETIGDGGAGKYLEITGRGQVDIECLVNGAWEVTGGSALYTFEV